MATLSPPPDWPSPSLLATPDGNLCVELTHEHIYTVTKRAGSLYLWIVDRQDPRTRWIQTKRSLSDPFQLSLTYTQAMFLGMLWNFPPRQVCLLGLGGGAMAQTLYHYLPQTKIDCAEISATVLGLAERYFGFVSDERVQCHVIDARAHLARSEMHYDIIFADVFVDKGFTPHHLTTMEFFALCKNHLSPEGVMVMNIAQNAADRRAKARTFCSAFEHSSWLAISASTTIWFGSDATAWESVLFSEAAGHAQETCQFTFPFVAWTKSMETAQTNQEMPLALLGAEILHDEGLPG